MSVAVVALSACDSEVVPHPQVGVYAFHLEVDGRVVSSEPRLTNLAVTHVQLDGACAPSVRLRGGSLKLDFPAPWEAGTSAAFAAPEEERLGLSVWSDPVGMRQLRAGVATVTQLSDVALTVRVEAATICRIATPDGEPFDCTDGHEIVADYRPVVDVLDPYVFCSVGLASEDPTALCVQDLDAGELRCE